MGIMTGAFRGIKGLFKLIALPVTKLCASPRLGRTLRWTLHLVLLAVILAGLTALNYVLNLGMLLRVPWLVLRMLWLPLLFLLIYLLAWLTWWLWRLIRSQPDESEWPDLEQSWREAKTALEHAGIDLSATPLYLVLGRPSSTERNLFAAAGLPLSVTQTPRNPGAPLHLFGNSEAVYVTCNETSLLARQATILAEAAVAKRDTEPDAPKPPDEVDLPVFGDETPGGPAVPTWREKEDLDQAVALLVEQQQPEPQQQTPISKQPQLEHGVLSEDTEQVDRCTRRLQYLCKLIARDREPYCPINGLLVLVPFGATGNELAANETAILLERDLETVHEMLQVRCPLVTMISDIEEAPGGKELLERFPEGQRNRRLGVSLPHLAQCDAALVPEMIETGVRWVCRGLIPPVVYRLARTRCCADAEADADLAGNIRLYHFMHELRSREERIYRILIRAICPESKSPWLVAGCYLAATGQDAVRGRGFTGGVFPQLLQMQNEVAWTPQALADDASCRRWTTIGYVTLVLWVAGVIALAMLA